MTAEYEPTDLDAASKRQEDQKQTAEQKLAEERADWQFLMSDARGRRVIRGLLEQAGVYRVSFSTEPMRMAFNEGGRNLGLSIVHMIHAHAPAAYEVMKSEAK